jgi:hypothetical protein
MILAGVVSSVAGFADRGTTGFIAGTIEVVVGAFFLAYSNFAPPDGEV